MTSRLLLTWQTDFTRLTFGNGRGSSGYILGTQPVLVGDRLLKASYIIGIGTQSYQVEGSQRNRVVF